MSDYKECVALYFDFFRKKNEGIPPKFNAGDGKLMKYLIKHLEKIGSGGAIENLKAIFRKWHILEEHNKFYKNHHDIKMIYSCINYIIMVLKSSNGSTLNFLDYYDQKFEKTLNGNMIMQYHKHLESLGWKKYYSGTAGTVWTR